MKQALTVIALCVLTILLPSCGGPGKAELRQELQLIEGEMFQLNILAQNLRSQMNQAEWESFFGSFAAGYGAVRGDRVLTFQGGGTTLNATGNYNRANYNLQQVSARWGVLSKRRSQILKKLR